uniref:Uncharacterized protein n=1 Tax=Schizaphis graminum TaxID=13262 RepID=A0A2S2N658_SCHGA
MPVAAAGRDCRVRRCAPTEQSVITQYYCNSPYYVNTDLPHYQEDGPGPTAEDDRRRFFTFFSTTEQSGRSHQKPCLSEPPALTYINCSTSLAVLYFYFVGAVPHRHDGLSNASGPWWPYDTGKDGFPFHYVDLRFRRPGGPCRQRVSRRQFRQPTHIFGTSITTSTVSIMKL